MEEIDKKLTEECDLFNQKYKIGDVVQLEMDDKSIKEVTIWHEATVLGNHTAVGWFKEISGCYLLSRVRGLA